MKALYDKIIKLSNFKKFIGLIILINTAKSLHEKCEEIYEKYKKTDIKDLVYKYLYKYELLTLWLKASKFKSPELKDRHYNFSTNKAICDGSPHQARRP